MRKLIILLILCSLSVNGWGQAKAAKKMMEKMSVKSTKKAAFEAAKKRSEKELLKEGMARTGRKYTGQALGDRIVRRSLRESVMKEMEKEGVTSFLEYGHRQALKDLRSLGLSNFKRKVVNKEAATATKPAAYHMLIENNALQAGKRASKDEAKKLLGKTVGKIIKLYEGKEAIAFLDKNNKEIAKQIKVLMGKGGPFEHPDYHKFICEVGENGDVIVRNSHPDALSSAIKIKGNTITSYSGGTKKCGASNMFLDKPLPNKKYVVDDGKYVFSTDAKGRTSSVVAKYDKTPTEIKPSLDEGRRKLGVLDKGGNTATHDAGHITQHNLGGINEGINLVPMKNTWQRSGGEWRKFEEQEEKIIAEALGNGKNVTSKRQLVYSGDSKIPSKIIVEVMVDGKSKISKTLVCPN